MKILKTLGAVLILAAIILVAGCVTGAFKTLATIETTTTAAYDAYASQVTAGTVSTNSLHSISTSFNKFQSDFLVALDGVQFNTNALAPESLAIESQDLLNAIVTATKK